MTIEHRVGRLCEARFASPFRPNELAPFITGVRRLLLEVGRPCIFCCDARRLLAFPPDISDGLTQMMRGDNPMVEKNGIISGGSSVFGMQIDRMFREAGNPGRRAFTKVAELEAWLAESLDPAERQRLAAFLAEGDAPR